VVSLHSGFATTAANGGASEAAIMRQTRHRSVQVVRGYIRAGDLFQDTATAKFGLLVSCRGSNGRCWRPSDTRRIWADARPAYALMLGIGCPQRRRAGVCLWVR